MHTTQLQAKSQDFRINELSQQLLELKGASLTMTMLKHKGDFLEYVEVFFHCDVTFNFEANLQLCASNKLLQ